MAGCIFYNTAQNCRVLQVQQAGVEELDLPSGTDSTAGSGTLRVRVLDENRPPAKNSIFILKAKLDTLRLYGFMSVISAGGSVRWGRGLHCGRGGGRHRAAGGDAHAGQRSPVRDPAAGHGGSVHINAIRKGPAIQSSG